MKKILIVFIFIIKTPYIYSDEVLKIFGSIEKKEVVIFKKEPDYIHGFHLIKIESYSVKNGKIKLKMVEDLIPQRTFTLLQKNREIELFNHYVKIETQKKESELMEKGIESFSEINFNETGQRIDFNGEELRWEIKQEENYDIVKILKKDKNGKIEKIIRKIAVKKVSGQLKKPFFFHIDKLLKIFKFKEYIFFVFITNTPLELYHPPQHFLVFIQKGQ